MLEQGSSSNSSVSPVSIFKKQGAAADVTPEDRKKSSAFKLSSIRPVALDSGVVVVESSPRGAHASLPVLSGRGGYASNNAKDPIAVSLQRLTIEGNTIVAAREASPGLTEMEFDVRRAVLKRLGFDNGGAMVLNSRAQAMIETLRIARDKHLEKVDAPYNIESLCLLAPDWDLSAWQRAAVAIGLEAEQVYIVRTDAAGRQSGKTLEAAGRRAEQENKTVFFWTAHHGAHSVGSGARDPLQALHECAQGSGEIFAHASAHLEGGHGTESLVSGMYTEDPWVKKFDSIHIDPKKMGLSLPGRGQLVLFADVADSRRHVKTELSKYLYHSPIERGSDADLYGKSWGGGQHSQAQSIMDIADEKESLGPDSPQCTQGSSLAGLWWHLRTQTPDNLKASVQEKIGFANLFITLCKQETFATPVVFDADAGANGLVAFSLPQLSDKQIQGTCEAGLDLGIEFKSFRLKGRPYLALRFVAPDVNAQTIEYAVKVLKHLLSNDPVQNKVDLTRSIFKPRIQPGYAPLHIDAANAYRQTYQGAIAEPSESEVAKFFDQHGLVAHGDDGLPGHEHDVNVLHGFMKMIHSGPKMSTRNHNQVGGFVAPKVARHVMDVLIKRPTPEEAQTAERFLQDFLLAFLRDGPCGMSALDEPHKALILDAGTIANKQAVVGALQHLRSIDGGFDRRKIAVFVPETAHYSFEKAIEALGLPLQNLIRVCVDNDQRTNITHLEKCLHQAKQEGLVPGFIAGVFGTTTAGVIDRVNDLSGFVHQYNQEHPCQPLWFHLDAAQGFVHYGTDQSRSLRHPPDSMTMDWHKAGLSFNTLATLLIFGDKNIDLSATGHHHPERVGIARYLQTLGSSGKPREAVRAIKAQAAKSRALANLFVYLFEQREDCPFKLVTKDHNSMVVFTLKAQYTREKSPEDIEKLMVQWREAASRRRASSQGSQAEQWMFNLVHIPDRQDNSGEDEYREIPCLRVNFVNDLHDKDSVASAVNQLIDSAATCLSAPVLSS